MPLAPLAPFGYLNFAMSLRGVDHFKTIRRILAHNDMLQRTRLAHPDAGPSYTLATGSVFDMSNMDKVWNNKRTMRSMVVYVVFMVSQLVINYVGIVVLDIENRPLVLTLSQIYNIFGSYFFPLIMAVQVDENVRNQFQDLNREAEVYRNFRLSAIVQGLGLALSVWATIQVFNGGPYVMQRSAFPQPGARQVDITSFVRVYQLITMQIVVCTLVLSLVNLYITDRRLVNYFNRIETTQDKTDLEAMFQSAQIPDDMYERDLKTYYLNGLSFHGIS